MKRLLVVEDEEVILKALNRLLERHHYEVTCTGSVDEAMKTDVTSFDLILADLRLPGDMGTALIPLADPVPVVIMTSHASVRSAVDAMRHGAIDYIAKPFDHDELLMVIERSLHQNLMQSQNRAFTLSMDRLLPLQQYIKDTALQLHLDNINTQSRSPRFLHLHGAPSTGRELLAMAIHGSSPYKEGPLLTLDVLSESGDMGDLLLGPLKSADASGLPSGGYLQAAHNGTLVIRHPEHLQAEVQRALCLSVSGSVLQNPANNGNRSVNIISISTQPIENLLAQGQIVTEFAELTGQDQHAIQPLCKRPRDIAILANRQLERLSRRYGSRRLRISEDAMAALMANEWPGNLIELDSLLTRAAFACRTRTIGLVDLGVQSEPQAMPSVSRDLSLDEYFRFFVLRNQASFSETELAARLGISRKALWERRQKMNLPRDNNDDLST